MLKKTSLIVAGLLASGCATIFSGTTQKVAIRTTPGATYHITNSTGQQVASGNSGGKHNLVRGTGYFSPHAYKVRINKVGYRERVLDIDPGLNPWYIGNILLGGIVGMLIVDPITGAMFNLHPSEIDAPLVPLAEASASDPKLASDRLQPTHSTTRRIIATIASRHDYTAWQTAKAENCQPVSDPVITNAGQPVETFAFHCGDGRELTMNCESGVGCR